MAAETPDTTEEVERVLKLKIAGEEYELVGFDDLTIDEWEIIYDESKVRISDIGELEDPEADAKRLERIGNPRTDKALYMIAYLRVHPDAELDKVRTLVGKEKLLPILAGIAEGMGQNGDDPTLTTERERQPDSSAVTSAESSSPGSSKSSETPDSPDAPTGTSG